MFIKFKGNHFEVSIKLMGKAEFELLYGQQNSTMCMNKLQYRLIGNV